MGCSTCDADHRNAVEERQRRDQHFDAGAKSYNQHQHFQDPWQRQEGINNAHQHFVDTTADQSKQDSNKAAPCDRDGRRDTCDQKCLAPAKEDTGKDIATQMIGAQPVGRLWPGQHHR